MALLFDGTNDTVGFSLDLTGSAVASFAFWLYWSDTANAQEAIEFGTADYRQGGFLVLPKQDATHPMLIAFGFGGTGRWIDEFTQPSLNVWHHCAFSCDRTNKVNYAWIDGVAQTLTAWLHDAGTPGNFMSSTCYLMSRAGSSQFGMGRMAELGIWNDIIFTDADAKALANGFAPPLVRPDKLHDYLPLDGRYSPEPNLRRGNNGTVTGAVYTEHPRVLRPFGEVLAPVTTSGPVSETPVPGGALAQGAGATVVIPLSMAGRTYGEGGYGEGPYGGSARGQALAGGTAPAVVSAISETPVPGGGIAQGVSPVARVSVAIGGSIAGGVAPSDSSAVSQTPIPGGALAAGAGASARTVSVSGGALAQGLAPVPGQVTVIQGAAAAGRAVPLVRISLVPGGALAGGFSPATVGDIVAASISAADVSLQAAAIVDLAGPLVAVVDLGSPVSVAVDEPQASVSVIDPLPY